MVGGIWGGGSLAIEERRGCRSEGGEDGDGGVGDLGARW